MSQEKIWTHTEIKLLENKLLRGDKALIAEQLDLTVETVRKAFNKPAGLTVDFRRIYNGLSALVAQRRKEDTESIESIHNN